MSTWVKHLLCKQEDLSSDPQNPRILNVTTVSWEVETGDCKFAGHLARPRQPEIRDCHKQGEGKDRHPELSSGNTCTLTCACIHTHTRIHTHGYKMLKAQNNETESKHNKIKKSLEPSLKIKIAIYSWEWQQGRRNERTLETPHQGEKVAFSVDAETVLEKDRTNTA